MEKSLYVDDLIIGGTTVAHASQVKATAIEIFAKGGFELHKWHSSAAALEGSNIALNGDIETYAKEQLGVPQGGQSSILGLNWDKETDNISVQFPSESAQATKRGILRQTASIYDPLGLISPVTLGGKLLYRDACDAKLAWDAELPADLSHRWARWERSLPDKVTVPRTLAKQQEAISEIELHAFGDASGKGVSAAVYAIVKQPSGINQGLVAAKSRLAKKGLTIPRLELVAGHMAVNLITNVGAALDGFYISSRNCWLDSSVALHWIRGQGDYRQFVTNRVQKICSHPEVTWRNVGTAENPADIGSRSGSVSEHTLWWTGPPWLNDKEQWPPDIVTSATSDSKAEAKMVREAFAGAVDSEADELNSVLAKCDYWRSLRVVAWMYRFIHNARTAKRERTKGPLSTAEIDAAELMWVKRTQARGAESCMFEDDKLQLNLQPNPQGVLECRGRIQGNYPVYLPDNQVFTEKFVMHCHLATLHGGVGLTMAKVRERIWVPRLRRLAKRVVGSCHGCRRFRAQAYAAPPPGNLPTDRTEGQTAYEVIGVDYAGPLKYRGKGKTEGKAYVLLYTCSLTRGVFLDLLPNLETTECLSSLKRFIARRGRPQKVYSDNGRTFVGAAKWLKQVMCDEKLQDFLAQQSIRWQFNLSRAPWWGGQFERLVGVFKSSLYKTIGNGMLSWPELQEVLLDVEVTLNNRPLSYVEDDVQLPTLTPSSLLYLQPNTLPDLQAHHIQDYDLRKRAKYLLKCKEAMWSRWTREYLQSLREHHRLKHEGTPEHPKVGEVVIIKSDERNKGKWLLGIVEELITGRDGIVRGAKLRAGKSHMERPVQHLYSLELSCDRAPPPAQLNPNVPPFRPQRDAATAARVRVQDILQDQA